MYESVKNELITIANSKAKGNVLRSKVRWHEEGEKSTKYFANMKKRNFNNKYITELESDDGVTTTVEKEILKQSATYYSNLYSKNANINNGEAKYKDFYNMSPDKKLSDVEKESLEGLLTKHECKKAPDKLATGKSPGVDGLTSEFYKAFWEQTSHLNLDSLNEAHKKGELTLSQNRGIIRLTPKPKKRE